MLKDFVCNLYAFSWRLQEKIMRNSKEKHRKEIFWQKIRKFSIWGFLIILFILSPIFIVFFKGSSVLVSIFFLGSLFLLELLFFVADLFANDYLYSLTHITSKGKDDSKYGFVKYTV